MGMGDGYVSTFRVVSISNGATEWQDTYSFTFGGHIWPWQAPTPGFSVQNTVGVYVVYTIVTPGETSIAGGTT